MLKTTSSIIQASQIATPISLPGNVTLSTGNLVIGTAGKGIDFSADPSAAGMTSELLSDYEEGTWTPTQGSGLTVVGAFSSSGYYTRVGRMVQYTGRISGATSVAVTAGGLMTAGFPYTSGSFPSTGVAVNTNASTASSYLLSGTSFYVVSAIGATTIIHFSGSMTVGL
jgi:hypothetical protein